MTSDDAPSSDDTSLEPLLAFLKRTRGFDFSGYKRTSLERRIEKRMQELGIGGYPDYLDYLEVHQDEFPQLFDTILINVTGFFRDQAAWDYLADETLPSLLGTLDDGAPIRVWCAACASGEETYTTAMVLAQALGDEAYLRRVKIYATEIDEDALSQARHGAYTAKQVEPVPPEMRERYFERPDQRYVFRKDLRRTIIFGRNDLTQDAPISRIDLLLCRNTLMYFNAEAQERIVKRLHFALNPWGYLFLGKSEMLITHVDLFRPVNLKRRVFTKVPIAARRDRLLPLDAGVLGAEAEPALDLRDGAFDVSPTAQILIDPDGVLVGANNRARALFGLRGADVGRPLKDLELSYRPAELRANLEIALSEHRTVTAPGVSHTRGDAEPRVLDVQFVPVRLGERIVGSVISFDDVTERRQVEEELESSRRELGNAYEELQSTVEELETTNEELQSTNEELETTNEELQSANEELETMNEELQSTNEELETMNDELRRRSLDLNRVNVFLEQILSTMKLAVVVVDGEQTVQIWNKESADLWGVRADEAQGNHLWGLDIGLPTDGVRRAMHAVLTGREERADLEVDATNRRGRTVRVRVTLLPFGRHGDEGSGAILLSEALDTGAEAGGARDGGPD